MLPFAFWPHCDKGDFVVIFVAPSPIFVLLVAGWSDLAVALATAPYRHIFIVLFVVIIGDSIRTLVNLCNEEERIFNEVFLKLWVHFFSSFSPKTYFNFEGFVAKVGVEARVEGVTPRSRHDGKCTILRQNSRLLACAAKDKHLAKRVYPVAKEVVVYHCRANNDANQKRQNFCVRMNITFCSMPVK